MKRKSVIRIDNNNFKCTECDEINTKDEWDLETEEYFSGLPVNSIGSMKEGYVYICPSCKKELEYKE